jgi:pimeloyl-ACP methyl ester carboxylesterase
MSSYLHVVAYDRAGLGASPPATDPVIVGRQVADLTPVITTPTTGRCVLAGHSWGGLQVQLVAVRRPDLAAGLVLVDFAQRAAHRGAARGGPDVVAGAIRQVAAEAGAGGAA